MSETTAEFLLQRLKDWDVGRIYGCPGDGINGIMGAFERTEGEDLTFTQTRHEEMASFMACAHAKFTGEVGVCLATSGPGAIHLLNGRYDAELDHQPVVAIVVQYTRLDSRQAEPALLSTLACPQKRPGLRFRSAWQTKTYGNSKQRVRLTSWCTCV